MSPLFIFTLVKKRQKQRSLFFSWIRKQVDREQMGEVDGSDVELSLRNKEEGFLNPVRQERGRRGHRQVAI